MKNEASKTKSARGTKPRGPEWLPLTVVEKGRVVKRMVLCLPGPVRAGMAIEADFNALQASLENNLPAMLKRHQHLFYVNVAAQGRAVWETLNALNIRTVPVLIKGGVITTVGETALELPQK